jgi:hypothetical protein
VWKKPEELGMEETDQRNLKAEPPMAQNSLPDFNFFSLSCNSE